MAVKLLHRSTILLMPVPLMLFVLELAQFMDHATILSVAKLPLPANLVALAFRVWDVLRWYAYIEYYRTKATHTL